MLKSMFQPCYVLGQTRRIGSSAPGSERMALVDLLILAAAGVAAATAVAAIPLQIHVPGHAILKATLPIVAGMALAPRRMAGTIMGIAAALTVLLFSTIRFGQWQPPALVALLAIGPAIDLALAYRAKGGWRLYLRFALAGLLANTLAFFARGGMNWFGLDNFRHVLAHIDGSVFLSFAACGVIAGLFSAVVCFRSSVKGAGD
jgi:hypothetical protein